MFEHSSMPNMFVHLAVSTWRFDVGEDAVVTESRHGADPDEQLIRTLHREHAGPLLTYVLQLVDGDRQRAEYVVQETLLHAWRSGVTGPVRPWLVTVARRMVYGGAPPRLTAVDDQVDNVLRLMSASDAMEALSAEHRTVLTETYLRRRTVNEAAAALGLPPATVRTRIFYAMRSLKLALEERGVTTS
jgi:RNA polymerase sigma-70 factor (ECF subfamily)